MKKNMIAILLSVVLAAGSIGTVPVLAAEETVEETVPLQEESADEGKTAEDSEYAVLRESLPSGSDSSDSGDTVSEESEDPEESEESEDYSVDSRGEIIQGEGIQDENGDGEIQESRAALNDSTENRVIHSGVCSECSWELYEDGTLYISTDEIMDDFSSSGISIAPWREYDVKKAVMSWYGLENIGDYAFYDCSTMTEVVFPESVTRIGMHAFDGCTNLTSVTIPEGVTDIEEGAFSRCGLTDLTIPGTVTKIELFAFYSCTDLKSVTIEEGATNIFAAEFWNCTSLSSVSIPETVTSIGYNAFLNCGSLQTITIPSGVTEIKGKAFNNTSLSTIVFKGSKPAMENDTFESVECTAYYPNTWESVPTATEYGGNVTWLPWDPSTESPIEDVTVNEGYELGELSNVKEGIQVSLPDVLETPQTCPDGFYLLKKEKGGEYEILVEYRVKKDWITPYTFEAQTYIDKNVEIGKKYSYAIQLFKGDVRGELGKEKEITRNWLPEIEAVIGYDLNRFPIYVTKENGIDVKICFPAKEFSDAYFTPAANAGSPVFFNGRVKLIHNGSAVFTAEPGSILIENSDEIIPEKECTVLTWRIGREELRKALLPGNDVCRLCFYSLEEDDSREENKTIENLIKEQPVKTSFERLSFCNAKSKSFEQIFEGTRVLDDQLISNELTYDMFGEKMGDKLIKNCGAGKPLGYYGLCFGMAAATDQFQAGLLSVKDGLNKDKLDQADQNDVFEHNGQSGTKALIDVVKRQQLYQHTAGFEKKKNENMFDFSGLLDAVDDYRTGRSKLMPMVWLEKDHSLLAYDYEINTEKNTVDLYVYEPGDPYRVINEERKPFPFTLQIFDYPSSPRWEYQVMDLRYNGSVSDHDTTGCEFSWVLPDWDIFSDNPAKDYTLGSFYVSFLDLIKDKEALKKAIEKAKDSFPTIDISIISQAGSDDSVLAWLSGDGEIDLTGVCSGLSLTGSDYEYTIEGAQSLVFDLETEEGGTASRVKSVTVGGNEDTVITYSFDGETDTKTFVKRLGGGDTLVTVESSDPDGSTDWSEVSSEPLDDGEQQISIAWSFDGETLTVSGQGNIPDYDSFRDTPWYSFRNKIRKVVIGEGIERIGNGAFCGTHGILYPESDPRGHDSILEVEFPSTLRSIGDSAFENCNQLKEVKLPQTFSGSIGKAAFHNCFSITTLDLGTSLTEIGEAAFKACTKIESVTIPASVKTIADGYAMESNTGTYLATVIPDTGVFEGCKGLKKVIYKSNADVAARMFAGCTSLTEADLVGSPGEIGAYAFYNGKSLSSVKIPSSVTTVSEGAFDKCDVLADVHYGGSREEWGKVSILADNEALQKASIHYAKEDVALGKTTRGDMFNLANNVKVTWKAVPGAKYYKVYREGISDPKESRNDPVIVTTGLIGWDKEPGLTNGHAYRYKIVASMTGKGDPSGDSKLSYSKLMYRLKTVVIRSVKNTAPGKVTVKYDRTDSGDSYVLQYCERQDMVGAKTKVVLGAANTSYVIGGLKKGKTYYISIRVRKKVNGIDYYTTFGVAKKIKVTQ